MKKSELIKRYEAHLAEEMVTAYESVLRCEGRISVDVLVNDEGDVWLREPAHGDNSWYTGSEATYITTVETALEESVFDISGEYVPEEERTEEKEEELIQWYVDGYRENVAGDVLGSLYEEARFCEKYECCFGD